MSLDLATTSYSKVWDLSSSTPQECYPTMWPDAGTHTVCFSTPIRPVKAL